MRLTLWTNNEKIVGSNSTEVIVLLKLLEHFIFYHYLHISHGLEDTSTVDKDIIPSICGSICLYFCLCLSQEGSEPAYMFTTLLR